MKKNAFTLAETLITLMIIGVVAALTIPSLMQVYKDKQLETATKKAMTTVANGFKLMIANNDATTEGLPLTQCGDDFSCLSGVFHKAFQIGADKSKTHEGLPEKYTKSGESSDEAGFVWDDVPYIFTTNDGMTYGYLANGFNIVVDLNGNKAPNKICKDVIKLSYGSGTVKASKKNDDGEEVGLCEDLNDATSKTDCGNFVYDEEARKFVFNGANADSNECKNEILNNFDTYRDLCIQQCPNTGQVCVAIHDEDDTREAGSIDNDITIEYLLEQFKDGFEFGCDDNH